MRLSARAIINFSSVNVFSYINQWIVRAGDPNTLYFQLIDIDQTVIGSISGSSSTLFGGQFNIPSGQANIAGLRYLVGIGVLNQPFMVKVTFPSSSKHKEVELIATQADVNDSSIWKLSIPPNLQPFSGNVQFKVIEGQNIRRFNVLNLISVEAQNDGSC
jgi:hypothetical protein